MKISNEINTSEISGDGVKAREAIRNEVQTNLIPASDPLKKTSETLTDGDILSEEGHKDEMIPLIKPNSGKSKDKFGYCWL